MAHMNFASRRTTLAVASAAALLLVLASIDARSQSTLAPVTITGKSPVPASVAGWGDAPLEAAPLPATAIDAAQSRDAGARRLADLTRFDPSVATAPDTEGLTD